MSTNTPYSGDDFNALWSKTDTELKEIISQAARKLLTQNIGISEELDLKRKSGVAQAVLTVKEDRRSQKAKIKKAYEEKIKNAYLNLKAAFTPNGQLVAAILEEEGILTESEIHNWCDELQVIDDSEFHALLQDLVADGVIGKIDADYLVPEEKYQLLRLCLKSLGFDYLQAHGGRETYTSWLKKILPSRYPDNDFEKFFENSSHILNELKWEKETFYPEDLFWKMDSLVERSDCESPEERQEALEKAGHTSPTLWVAVGDGDAKALYRQVKGVISRLHGWGVLSSFEGCYYLPLLGEKVE